MSRSTRLRAVAAIMLAGLGLLPLAPAAHAAPAGTAIEKLGGCLGAQKSGDLLVLVDQSASLQQTDPTGVRTKAANYLLAQLGSYAATNKIALDVAVSGFDVDYRPDLHWQGLTGSTLPAVQQAVSGFATRDKGIDTDYTNAMTGALADLRAKQRGSAGARCQAIVWISDGQFSIQPRGKDVDRKSYAPGISIAAQAGATQAENAGKNALCRRGGVMDQVRASGVLTFGVGLGVGLRPDDRTFDLMKGAAAGPGCGNPTSAVVGDFRLATDVDGLVFALGNLSDPGRQSIETVTGVCPRVACATQAHRFVLDGSISSVKILAGADKPGISIVLQNPLGGPAKRFNYVPNKTAGSTVIAGQQVNAHWITDKTLQIDMSHRADRGWVGQWSLVFVDEQNAHPGARARTQIHITGDLVPAVEGTPQLRSGDPATLKLGLASSRTGARVDPASIKGQATLSAVLVDASGATHAVAQDVTPASLVRGTTVDLDGVAPGSAQLQLSLAVTTAAFPQPGGRPSIPGTRLADQTATVPVEVLPPLGYPPVVSRSVDFGNHEGTGPFASAITVKGPGCVWLSGSQVDGSPEGVGAATVSSPHGSASSCLKVADGATGSLPVSLSLAHPGNGTVVGSLKLMLAPTDHTDRALPATLKFAGDVEKPVDAAKRDVAFLVALVLGIGLPVLFLYLVKFLAAKIPGEGLSVGVFDVQVTGGAVTRNGQAFGFTPQETQLVSVDPGGARELSLGAAGATLRSKMGWSPSSSGYVVVEAPGQLPLTKQGGGKLPLAVHNTWFGLVPAAGGQPRVAVLMSSAGANAQAYARVAQDVRDHLPELLKQVPAPPAGTVPSTTTSAPVPTGGWGSSGSGSPVPGAAAPPPAGGWGDAPSAAPAPPPPGSWGGPPAAPGSPPAPPAGGGWGSPPST